VNKFCHDSYRNERDYFILTAVSRTSAVRAHAKLHHEADAAQADDDRNGPAGTFLAIFGPIYPPTRKPAAGGAVTAT
jgi:hypothetical protein